MSPAALARFERLAALESHPALGALLHAAASRGLPHVLDESELTLGAGAGGQSFSLAALPGVAEVRWRELRDIPTAIVTGSNGKTTTVRLLAACRTQPRLAHRLQLHRRGIFSTMKCWQRAIIRGLPARAWSCANGVRRRPCSKPHAAESCAAESPCRRPNCALITNVSSDHFGEYGIDDLAGLADVKLTVATVGGLRAVFWC